MTPRQRYLNTLRGQPVDRLPFLETAQFNMAFAMGGWETLAGDEAALRRLFGFDNAGLPRGVEPVPVDWYAVPRFPQRAVEAGDGYRRSIDDRYGRTVKAIPASAAQPIRVRIFEDHVVASRADWLAVRHRFAPDVAGRFPAEWDAWCERARNAWHPVVLDIRDAAATIMNLLGEERFFCAFFEQPDLVREMAAWLAEQALACVDKAAREAPVDMVRVGSDATPMIGPNVLSDFFLEHEQRTLQLVRRRGIDLVCLQGRGDIRACIAPYRQAGVNGLCYVMETGAVDLLPEILATHGQGLFHLHAMDARVLLQEPSAIQQEVDAKLALAQRYRMIPDLCTTHILPEVRPDHYRWYAEYLRERVVGSPPQPAGA